MDLRRRLYAPVSLWIGVVFFLLPISLITVVIALQVLFLQGERWAFIKNLPSLCVAIALGICWAAWYRVRRYRITQANRKFWLRCLTFSVLLGLLLAFRAGLGSTGATRTFILISPLIAAAWIYLLVRQAEIWQPPPVSVSLVKPAAEPAPSLPKISPPEAVAQPHRSTWRRRLYAPVWLWLGMLLLLLPASLITFPFAFFAFSPHFADRPLQQNLVLYGFLLCQVICWKAWRRIRRYRITDSNRAIWLRALVFSMCFGVLLLVVTALLPSSRHFLFGLLFPGPFIAAIWLCYLVNKAPSWQPEPSTQTLERLRKTLSELFVPRPLPGGNDAVSVFMLIMAFMAGGAFAVVLSYGLIWNDMILLSKRGVQHIHGPAVWTFAGFYLCLALGCFSVIAGHFDRRANADGYRIFRWRLQLAGWRLFFCSIALLVLFEM